MLSASYVVAPLKLVEIWFHNRASANALDFLELVVPLYARSVSIPGSDPVAKRLVQALQRSSDHFIAVLAVKLSSPPLVHNEARSVFKQQITYPTCC